MEISLINSVIVAQDFNKLVEWYTDVFEMKIQPKFGDYNYTDLTNSGKIVLGIVKADEAKVDTASPRNNHVFAQLSVSDIDQLFEKVKDTGGKILTGPLTDKNFGFKFGKLEDIEGNQIWVIENYDQIDFSQDR